MKVVERLVSILAPHECLGCGTEGSLLCAWCLPDACPVVPERCYRCFALSTDSKVCTKCRKKSPLSHVWVRTEYEGIGKQLLYRLKFGRASAAAKPIAILMAESLPYVDPETIITHVPTASSRHRQRGYDQSALIARLLARETGARYIPLLARLGQTRQVGSNRSQRLQQLTQSFRPIRSSYIKGAAVIIVDDIVTTGASIEASARVLKMHGAKSVSAALFAVKT